MPTARPLALLCLLLAAAPAATGGRPASQSVQAQEPPPRGAITGTVVDGVSGEPVPGALVFITALPARRLPGQTRQVTDARGRFAFVGLAGDTEYTIAASKFGYLDGGFGRDAAPTDPLRPIALDRDRWIGNLRVSLWTPGAISGTVRDESGEPVVGVFVRVLRRLRLQGRDDLAAGPLTTSDDRGAYRISGLPPGRYIVQVPSVQASVPAGVTVTQPRFTPPDGILDAGDGQRLVIGRYPLPPPPADGRRLAYPPMFHPSTPLVAQATVVDLTYGDDRTNVDLTLTPAPIARVSGVVQGPPEALRSLTLRLLPSGLEHLGLGSEAATALVAADGTFTFTNVPAGAYVIDAPVTVTELTGANLDGRLPGRTRFPMPPPAQGSSMTSNEIDLVPGLSIATSSYRGGAAAYSGRTTVTVSDADVSGVVVPLHPHAAMSGRVIVERDPARPNMTPPGRFPIRLDPANGNASQGWPRGTIGDTPPDRFVMDSIAPGRYWLRVQGYAGWLIKSAIWNGRDHSTMPFDLTSGGDIRDVVVTVTNAVPVLSGAVRAASAEAADTALVIAFPADPAAWRDTGLWPAHHKAATVSATRTFEITTLPAGDYLVAAIPRARAAEWQDPAFLQTLAPRATRVTLTWGQRTSLDLTLLEAR